MTVLLDPQSLAIRPLLDGIQGNILKSHGRHHTANIFIRCYDGQQTSAKAWLKSLVEGEDAIIQSGYAQLRTNVLWKEERVDTGLFACIHISAAGYDYLFGSNKRALFDDVAFQNGMKQSPLNDPAPETWDSGLAVDNHFMLLLAHANPESLTESIHTIVQPIESFAEITALEKGDALLNKEKAGIEHFGYVDGISQPLFFTDEWETYVKNNNIKDEADIRFDPRAAKELVLVQDPFLPNDSNALGSYFVFRKLEQNVKGFKLAEENLAAELGLEGEDKERAGAMLVGRFEDGTPVELSDEAGLINSAVLNNFDYNLIEGSKCPFHGHIRKTNPRSSMPAGSGGMEEAKKHSMARRGIPFGKRTDDPNDGHISNKPEGCVGLLFMSYQNSITTQFELIQSQWANNQRFPHTTSGHINHDGIDSIIGQALAQSPDEQNPRGDGAYAAEWGNSLTQQRASFAQFVHLKGGEYFFAPSMSFLKRIDKL
ncbi:Dyp-type peroxidase [Spirosoma linguale]|uniref:Iron-dependent peroxidase-like protein n=1 Tax=Spirosoma linguale (strain ATCC 33905 / DSM 74 / LMG 10896 / Claus 1) TaxID=504472 RepID=D2QUB3_SPILD|nr:iron-dependent peroxidase-like protein [Spirosoma linguale DSM 74]